MSVAIQARLKPLWLKSQCKANLPLLTPLRYTRFYGALVLGLIIIYNCCALKLLVPLSMGDALQVAEHNLTKEVAATCCLGPVQMRMLAVDSDVPSELPTSTSSMDGRLGKVAGL